MIKTIIIDDEQHCSDRILSLIEQHPNTFNVLAIIDTVEDAVKMVPKLQPDLVYLDIKIHDKTGFEFLQELGNINFKIIFTTAFDNFAIKAFKFSAFDYLLKPIDSDDFNDALIRLKADLNQRNTEQQLQNLFKNLKPDQKKVITIPSLTGFETLKIDAIIHLEADTNYTHIFTQDGKTLVSKPIKFYEDLLADNAFFKTHKSHLINLDHVKKYFKGKQSYVLMSNDAQVPISVRRKDEFLKHFI
ncbi:LytR/AlgR family response regulator transcription factor [Winogradskyella psychrotolerans]|uniref:LytR/AlgR family response regulator transcription factor n=1 Tax=Winogradskyella psychrotolerans TaxID=1344585 RepID=UPI001C06A7B4|nr:LytTR family DNA-binding domain-containing protein [Winogradskyella psychrotolerans]MBU2929391.1 LytTR family DNA-binding domain-containing protein [Winogradskyella psychrotolerans]